MFTVVLLTVVFLAAFPSLTTDTDPVHMLPQDNPAVVLHNKVKEEFKIYDYVVLGVESRDDSSLFTKAGLAKIHKITKELLEVKDYQKETTFSKFIKKLQFLRKDDINSKHDPELFVKSDFISLSTVDDIVKNSRGELLVTPLMANPPNSDAGAQEILKKLNENPILGGKLSSKDGSLIGIFVPLKEGKKERSYFLSNKMKEIAQKHLGPNERYYVAGLPVAESTFGNEMFLQMAVYAPAAGLVIFLLMLFFFRNIKMVIAPMILGVVVVIWSMGALIYSGNAIHIMSSMIPIFLLPIAVLNSIHILSKLSDRIKKFPNKKEAINDVMAELFTPMLYTSLTTIVGFVSLATTGIPPVIVFGVTIGFGVFLAWLLSIIFIPAYTMLLSDKALKNFGAGETKSFIVEVVRSFRNIAIKFPKVVIAGSIVIVILSIMGLSQIIVNDNPVRWFKEGHFIREADGAMSKKLAGTYFSNLHFEIPKVKESNEKIEDGDDFSEFDEFDSGQEVVNPSIKDPTVVAYMEKIETFLLQIKDEEGSQIIGDVVSFNDVLRKVGSVAVDDPKLPTTREQVSQYMFLFESGDTKKGKDMWTLVTPGDSLKSQMWVMFKSGDNQKMIIVKKALDKFIEENKPPVLTAATGEDLKLKINWSGLVYINYVWQKEMVEGMIMALIGSFLIVFVMMIFLFKSIRWGAMAMLPLSITIAFIYGVIGFSGKFYDMPIAILSSLTLGLSVDFAIHFIEHFRMFNKKYKCIGATFDEMFNGTAQAIWRNVLVVSVGFLPLFFAGLVPYVTVGAFFFAIMLVSGITTLILMPSIVSKCCKFLPGVEV
jgi:predicted RND superfamily exporter protein